MKKVELLAEDFRKLVKWLDNNNIPDNALVELKTKSNSMGTEIEAKTKTYGNGGIWVDLTDYDNW